MNEQIKAIRAEIERRIKEYDAIIESQPDSNRSERAAWKWAEDKSLLSFIESLLEEPAPKGYDEAYLNECIAKASKTWEGVDVDKYMGEVRGSCPKLSDSLEEAAEQYADSIEGQEAFSYGADHYCWGDVNDAFIAGAKWQAGQNDKDLSEKIAAAYQLGLANKKEQMMKDAVEGKIYGCDGLHWIETDADENIKGKEGDKVRIIIVKEDEQ